MGDNRRSNLAEAFLTSFIAVGFLFVVLGIEVVFHVSFAGFGIVPRTEAGLLGILFGPLLHANLQHLLANALPLFVLLVLLLSNPAYHPYATLSFIWFGSGIGTWLIGRGNAVHMGASSVIFGLAAFLILAGFLMKSWRFAFVAIFVFLFYGGIFYGVVPQNGPISWEAHLCGAISGVVAAIGQRRQ
ncbi:MAG TPA: rhomboid family intramembrane serine protease [Candidatus Limnocylindrales bacterium]|jgi:membrane associated rhomboid family serine protease|nr:rhomboid family intramembrane serine protease [Candidatus Limnocylindrales bacterium]